jgi:hypothetical protein
MFFSPSENLETRLFSFNCSYFYASVSISARTFYSVCNPITCLTLSRIFDPAEAWLWRILQAKYRSLLSSSHQSMAPHGARRRIVTSPEPDEQPSSGPPAPPSQPVTTQDGENFNLDDVSGSDKPAHSNPGRNEGVNNADTALTKLKSTADVNYFFDKKGDTTVCMVCK